MDFITDWIIGNNFRLTPFKHYTKIQTINRCDTNKRTPRIAQPGQMCARGYLRLFGLFFVGMCAAGKMEIEL